MTKQGKAIKIFAGNSHKKLAEDICAVLGVPLGKADVTKFSDGEIAVNVDETVRGCDVFIIQSTSRPAVNQYLMELLILIDALKRASAGSITAVIPYYGYARQDRKAKARDPISAKLVADLLTASGADRVLTMDLHAPQIQGYFNIPVDHLLGGNILAKYFNKKQIEDLVVVSPDLGSVSRSRNFADRLGTSIAIIDKRRQKANESEVMNVIGEIEGKNCILIDDMIDTAGTICNAAAALQSMGAKDVYACCTHGVFSGPAFERLEKSVLKEVVSLDTIYIPDDIRIEKMEILSVAEVFAESIRRIFNQDSISTLFDE